MITLVVRCQAPKNIEQSTELREFMSSVLTRPSSQLDKQNVPLQQRSLSSTGGVPGEVSKHGP